MPKQTFFNLPDQKREHILDCAVGEFARQGYRHASINRIVEAAGIAKGSFYQYFEDKDDLYVHIILTQIGDRKRNTYKREEDRLKEMNLSEFLRHVFKAQLEEFRQRPELFKISMDIMHLIDDPVYKKIRKCFDGVAETYFLSSIRREMQAGEIDGRVNAQLLNFMLVGIGQYVLFLLNTGAAPVVDEALLGELADDLDFILTNGIYPGKDREPPA